MSIVEAVKGCKVCIFISLRISDTVLLEDHGSIVAGDIDSWMLPQMQVASTQGVVEKLRLTLSLSRIIIEETVGGLCRIPYGNSLW